MKVKSNVKAGQGGIAIAVIGQSTTAGDANNQGGAIGILNTITGGGK
jgi:hypothetical protein